MCPCVFLCAYHFHRFHYVKRGGKTPFLQGVFSPSAGWLWASAQAGASHPFHVTLGSGLESVSWCGTKCLACESTERGYGANCPSQVHQSSVGLQCTWDYMNDQFGVGWGCAAMCHPRVHMCGGEGNVSVCVCVFVYIWKAMNVLHSTDVHRIWACCCFFSVLFEVRGAVTCAASGCGSIVNF